VLDLAIQVVLLLLVLWGAGSVDASETATVVAALVAVLLIRIVYPVAFETRFGATIGQRAMGLRIVTDEGGPIRLRQGLVRAAVGLFEIEMTTGLLAFTVAASRADGKRLGDVAAGTLAVSVRVGTTRADVLGVTCPPGLEGWATTLDTSGLTAAHRGTLRRFHERTRTLPPDRAAALAGPLVERLLVVLAARRPPGASDVALLQAIEWAAGEETTGRRAPPPPSPDRDTRPEGSAPPEPPTADPSRPGPGATPTPPPRAGPATGAPDDDTGFAPPS
jgi:uncharacterized RDD family membrane protein YckC